MKKIFLFFVIFIFCNLSYSQGNITKKFYLEIPNESNIPTVIEKNGHIKLKFSNRILTTLFNNYKILNFEFAFPGAKNSLLKTVYIIECDEKLIEKININYSSYFGRNEEIRPIEILYIPNDLGGTSGSSSMVQPELNFVRAIEAWDISKADNVSVGIAEQTNVVHEDLIGKCINVYGVDPPSNSIGHGTKVAIVAAGKTDNNIGISSIGFNASIKSGYGYSALIPIANSGARVINMSWGSCNNYPLESQYGQLIIDQLWDSGIVLVAAAGNGGFSCPTIGPTGYHYPAALNNVIAVTAVGHRSEINSTIDGNRKDIFENFSFGTNSWGVFKTTYNDKVDISAPGFNILTSANIIENGYSYDAGTSFSAPMVTGLIGLMFGVNSCLFPNEVESILKLTAVKNDNLTLNLPYKDKIGAGRIDAYEAVKMSKEMSLPFGTVEIKDRIIDRWNFNLRTSPYNITMLNNIVENIATLDFTARNDVDVLSGDYRPSGIGFIDLKINSINNECNTPPQISETFRKTNKEINDLNQQLISLFPNPNNGNFTVNINEPIHENIQVSIYDLYGKLVYNEIKKENTFKLNVSNLLSGIYIVKIQGQGLDENHKLIKN